MVDSEKVIRLLPLKSPCCGLIKGFFTERECDQLLSANIKASFQKADTHYPTSYRNNDRYVFDSRDLAESLFSRAKMFLPENLNITNHQGIENGNWKLHGLNPRIRFCRYRKDQSFSRHQDGVFFQSENIQSKLTFLLYLNGKGEFTGGRTLFFSDKNSNGIIAKHIPKKGDLIFFDHHLWHKGEVVTQGTKYILRSDVLYSRKENYQSQRIKEPYSEGHWGYIWRLILLKNNYLLSGGRDKLLKMWNSEGKCTSVGQGHDQSILAILKFSGSKIISGSRDQTIRVWKIDWYQECLSPEKIIHSHHATILSLEKLSDHLFASAGSDGNIVIMDEDGNIKKTLSRHTNWVWEIMKKGPSNLVSCSEDGSIKLWDYISGACLDTLVMGTAPKNCLAVAEDESLILCGDSEGKIHMITCREQHLIQIHELEAHNGIIRSLLFLGNGLFASCGEDNMIKIWDIETLTCCNTFAHKNFVQSMAKRNQQLLSCSYDGKICVWNID